MRITTAVPAESGGVARGCFDEGPALRTNVGREFDHSSPLFPGPAVRSSLFTERAETLADVDGQVRESRLRMGGAQVGPLFN